MREKIILICGFTAAGILLGFIMYALHANIHSKSLPSKMKDAYEKYYDYEESQESEGDGIGHSGRPRVVFVGN